MHKLTSAILDAYREGSAESDYTEFVDRIIEECMPIYNADIINEWRNIRTFDPEEAYGEVSIIGLMTLAIQEEWREDFHMYYGIATETVAHEFAEATRGALEAGKELDGDIAWGAELDADSLDSLTADGVDSPEEVHATIIRAAEFLDAHK
jgi:hypothetical protein